MTQQFGKILVMSALCTQPLFGQVDTKDIVDPYTLTIEDDILNLKVQSAESRETYAASRDTESLFETVTATYLITADEIKQSGALTIGEVLRLAPGLMVKQKTNGYFEVTLRGNYGVIDHQGTESAENITVLLTIDGIPQNNRFQGGILWEAIPVEVHDIQQVEIVASPNTVFFGPDASGGVINIVTKKVEEKNLQAKMSLQGSLNKDYAHRGSASFGVSDQLKFRVSAYYNRFTRFQDEFYLLNEQRYIQSDSLLHYQATARQTNVSSEKSLRNNGVNAFATFQPASEISVEAMVGTNESYLQSITRPIDRIALTNRYVTNNTFSLRTRIHNFTADVAYQSGTKNLAVGYDGFHMYTGSLFASAGYTYTGRYYQVQVGGDLNYTTLKNTLPLATESFVVTSLSANRVLLGTNNLSTTGAFLSQNLYLMNRKWRWQAAVRADLFDVTNQLYESYRLGTTYQLGKAHQLRASTAYGLGNLTAQNFLFYDQTTFQYQPNLDLKPLRTQTYEAGYRVVPLNDLFLELTYFRNESSNYINALELTTEKRSNSSLTSLQNGITLDLKWSINKLKASAFYTMQNTKVVSESEKRTDLFVPGHFGGITGSYRTFLNKLRVNAGFYYYGKSQWAEPSSGFDLKAKLIANCKISYNVWDEHVLFFNGRNVLGSNKVESFYADQIKSLYMIGVDLAF